jgi:hypothetical protein
MRAGRIADDKLPGGHLVAPLAIDLGWWIGDVATRGVPDGPHGIDEP